MRIAVSFHKSCSNTRFAVMFVLLLIIFLVLLRNLFHHGFIKRFHTENEDFLEDIKMPSVYADDIAPQQLSVNYSLVPEKFLQMEEVFMFFFVKSSPTHYSRRKVIRETWGSIARIEKHRVALIFLIGSAPKHLTTSLKYENGCFQDILQTNLLDTYENLTLKTLSAFLWIKNKMKNKATFHIFTDDDCVVDLYNTLSFLELKSKNGRSDSNCIYCGFAFEKTPGVIRGSGRLGASLSQYSSSHYPAFCRGVMVILTYDMIKRLYEVSTRTNYTQFLHEDIMVYGILRNKLNKDNYISSVINGGHSLVYYPWDNSATAAKKMRHKWLSLRKSLYNQRKYIEEVKRPKGVNCH